jgi:hypothetical protein
MSQTDLARDRFNFGPTCTICPSNLSMQQHHHVHYSLVRLRFLIHHQVKFHPFKSKPTSKAYHFKLEEINLVHRLGFCQTDDEINSILVELFKLVEEIKTFLRIRKLTTRCSNLRI